MQKRRRGFHYSGAHGASDKRVRKKERGGKKRKTRLEFRYRLVTGNSLVGSSGSERQDRQVWFTSGSLRPAGQPLFFFVFFFSSSSSIFFLYLFFFRRHRVVAATTASATIVSSSFIIFSPLYFFATLLTPVLILTPKGRCNKVHSRK